jgi:hypothetical protein
VVELTVSLRGFRPLVRKIQMSGPSDDASDNCTSLPV